MRTRYRYIYAIFGLIISLTPMLRPLTAQAGSPSDNSAVNLDTNFYDPFFQDCTGNGSGGGPVYILGDSITEGAAGAYQQQFHGENIDVNINASVDRSLNTPGQDGVTGMQAIQADKALIAKAGTIVIALGTNGFGTDLANAKNQVSSAINAINNIIGPNSNAQILWVDTFVLNRASYNKSTIAIANQAIYTASDNNNNYKVLSWAHTVDPNIDPKTPADSPQNPSDNKYNDADPKGYIDTTDGVNAHPKPAGINALVNLVSNQISASSGGGLVGTDNQQKAFNFLVDSVGLSAAQAAGFVGNLIWESSVNPHATNPIGPHHGIAQWGGSRLTDLIAFANQHNEGEDSLLTQLQFVKSELNNGYKGSVLDPLKAIGGNDNAAVDKATTIVFAIYEDPGDNTLPNREKLAESAFAKDGKNVTGGGSDGSGNSSCNGGADFTNGFVFYDQCDKAWGSDNYGDTNICAAGCGPSAMAMIITNLTGNKVTPPDTANYADTHGLYIPGAGSSWSIGPVEAAHWGLKSHPLANDVAAITNAVNNGALVILTGEGAEPFTFSGHFILIRGVQNGKWLIGDSDGAHVGANHKLWDPNQIMVEANAGSIFAISK